MLLTQIEALGPILVTQSLSDLRDDRQNSSKYQRTIQMDVAAITSRIIDSYRLLLKRSVLEESLSVHEELQISNATGTIIFNSQSLLDIIQELRLKLLLFKQ